MALILPRSIFIHIPKTGGSWVRSALQRAGLAVCNTRHRDHILHRTPVLPYCCTHSGLSDVSDADRNGRLSFAFVRHPITFYQSYWAFSMRIGWDDAFLFERTCKSDTFSQFLENVLTHFPGWAGQHYRQIDEDGIQMVGRQESLAEDLITILTHAEEKFDPDILRDTTPQNVAGMLSEWQEHAQYTPELKRAILENERETLARFGYGEEPHEIMGSCRACGVGSEESAVA